MAKAGDPGWHRGRHCDVFVGFNQGGWILGGSAERMAQQRSVAAVTQALIPVCISQSKADPEAAAKLKQLGALETSYERHEFVMKSGWATVPAAASPNSDLADACADALSKVKPT
jgi:hypothetical protein